MRVRYLGWAGLEIQADGATAVIDLLEDSGPIERLLGRPRTALLSPEPDGSVRVALLTHLHPDHADPPALTRALTADGVVLRPAPARGDALELAGTAGAEAALAELGLSTQVVEPWQTVESGPFTITAVPAVDGFGDPQVGWVVAAEGRRVIVYGDTLFHGDWWRTRMRLGPFDAAFLPVNGAVVDFPHRQPPSPIFADMTPEQAAAAAVILQPGVAVPVHYDTFANPPVYAQVNQPAAAFADAATRHGVAVRVLAPGDCLALDQDRTVARVCPARS